YAFDAGNPSSVPLWMTDFTRPPSITPVPITDIVPMSGGNIIGNIGIQGTPVIDQATHTIYLVARTKENGEYVQRLHALDIISGGERPGSPVEISGSVPGTAADSTVIDGTRVVTFDLLVQVQRTGLALTNGVVLIGWAAHEDVTPSHGWIMGFDATTLARVANVAVTPDEYLSGKRKGGRALSARREQSRQESAERHANCSEDSGQRRACDGWPRLLELRERRAAYL